MALFFDVLLDGFVRDVAATDTKVAARPQVTPPEFLSQMWKLLHQFVGTLPLQHLEQPTDGQARRHAHEQMDVIARDVPFDDRHFMSAADFSYQFSDSRADFSAHHGFAILCNPNNMQMDAKDCMRAVPIFCHAAQSITERKTC